MMSPSPYLKETEVGERDEEGEDGEWKEGEGPEGEEGEKGGGGRERKTNQNLLSEEEECFHF